MASILVLHGPNLNLLGSREQSVYGSTTLQTINEQLTRTAAQSQHTLNTFQSNSEAELINAIHASQGAADGIIINPAAFTHTSVALRDALLAVQTPFIEVHLSNVHAREAFRHTSYLSDVALGVIFGFGPNSYQLALTAILDHLTNNL
ncbi:MAG: type II 3-dehydroquinate dehydratase [Pseudomonadota bacterium]